MKSWLPCSPTSDFSAGNLPYGIFSVPGKSPRPATVVGETVIDICQLQHLFEDILENDPNVFNQETLNTFASQSKSIRQKVRARLLDLISEPPRDDRLYANKALQKACFWPLDQVRLHLPVRVGDYTDFYSSREHATNVGTMFRGRDKALQPNWLHLPVGYHGRSSTVFVSPHSFPRPCGQLQKDPQDPAKGSIYGPSKLLDFELEVAAIVGGPDNVEPLSLKQAKDRIFGFCLMNDWSARDIQKWEYVPLGPFTSKNFATTISPWIVTSEALEAFAAPTSAVSQTEPKPLEYLVDPEYSSYDIALTVEVQSASGASGVVCTSNFKNLYWNAAQQLVHHSVTGCIMKAGDLLGSGTISGSEPNSFGSMLELSWRGSKTVNMGDETRTFLKDGDTVVMRGCCPAQDGEHSLGFGSCSATVLPQGTLSPLAHAPKDRFHGFKLYGFWRSSCAWRVRIALEAKNIPFETIPIDLSQEENKKEDYLAINPLGQVPYLACTDSHTGKTVGISQSITIIEFLEKNFPNRRTLTPTDTLNQAFAGEILQIINSGIQPLQNVFYLKHLEDQSQGLIKANDEAKSVIERGLGVLESMVVSRREALGGRAGPYCTGSFVPSVADCYLIPQLFNARRFGVDVDAICPTLVTIDSLCSQLQWFASAHPTHQPDYPS